MVQTEWVQLRGIEVGDKMPRQGPVPGVQPWPALMATTEHGQHYSVASFVQLPASLLPHSSTQKPCTAGILRTGNLNKHSTWKQGRGVRSRVKTENRNKAKVHVLTHVHVWVCPCHSTCVNDSGQPEDQT